jgi:hypothetical protein
MVEEVEYQGYEVPRVEDLGTLEAITGSTDTGKKNEGASVKT